MASLSTGVPYALTNAYTGTVKFLAIPSDSGAPQMVASSDAALPASAQWFLTATDVDPFYYLHTVATGEGKALDVINDNGTSSVRLHLVGTGRFTGQYWRFDPWSASGGEYRLSNNFTGPDRHLDVYSDTLEPHLASGDYSGQHWTL
ncbi:carbohydrate-binding module family 13 protein, partial [Schizothecium vesticola]